MSGLLVEISVPFYPNQWEIHGKVPGNKNLTVLQPLENNSSERILFISDEEDTETTVFHPINQDMPLGGGRVTKVETLLPILILQTGDTFYTAEEYISDTKKTTTYPYVIRVTRE